ncbi:methyltransferase domain-containing protein [Phyllobacterium chamaecytisi]|uniref:methyltransferase domain-containing protein n=1 Tax=Phyllobacterium chamaecytisi TaxID=2876082 RepID=UPI001CCC49D4|nr:class I SAM-dependent methyltransferase [Phyllobacterium sp. KW56]MBZ9601969.1 class I SAM-dependent methyltransferase [Phyllobacterium sp. KW56]
MQSDNSDLLAEVAEYYSGKLAQYGQTPRGVDWNGEESQTVRFDQLCKVIGNSKSFSINDLGCGYGSLFEYLNKRYDKFNYSGFDVSHDMVRSAQDRQKDTGKSRFIVASEADEIADYGIASGIFNVRLTRTDTEWHSYVSAAIDALDRTSRLGFAFNCLTSYSDANKMQEYLYYADPCELFDLCKRRYSRNVALLHDYGLYEFTILVRKS